MAQKHSIDYTEYPMTRDGRIQGPSRRYRRLRHPIFPAATWTAKNPLLQRGEIGAESDTYRMKIGDGVTYWNDLPYSGDTIITWGDIQGDIADQTDLQNALDAKQDVLTAGSNIQIDSDNVISATDTTYTASDGVTLTGTNFTNSGVRAVVSGTANGTISVNTNGTSADVAVTGLGSAAYTSSSDYATSAQGEKADTAVQPGDLATVATTGSYNDLLNKPTIPAAQVNSDWDAVSGVAQILNKPSLSTVATSGDYDDLLNKPTIPTVNNATLTIQKNGTTVNTFTANASSNVTANITVPTKISDLTNDSNFANTDLSNLTSTGANIGNWSSNVTNCITEIPQDIKVEIFDDNGTPTFKLKSGSKITAPDGTTKTTTQDQTGTISSDGQYFVFTGMSNGSFQSDSNCKISQCGSGSSLPADGSTYRKFLNTTDSKMYRWTSNGWVVWEVSLPVAIITVSSGAISSIDQVFNGFGYIGLTVFALPGVKGLIPNGRNADGTLKSTAWERSSLGTKIITANNIIGARHNAIGVSGAYSYNEQKNQNLNSGSFWNVTVIGKVLGDGTIKLNNSTFHAVDYSDGEYIANCAMPSDKYVDLTLPASDGTITAPADGSLYFNKVSSASGQRIKLNNTNGTEASVSSWSSATSQALEALLLVSKGDVIRVNYNAGGTTNYFRFIYANGAK